MIGYFDDLSDAIGRGKVEENLLGDIARRGLRTANFSGRTWDRTRDLPRVKRALSR